MNKNKIENKIENLALIPQMLVLKHNSISNNSEHRKNKKNIKEASQY